METREIAFGMHDIHAWDIKRKTRTWIFQDMQHKFPRKIFVSKLNATVNILLTCQSNPLYQRLFKASMIFPAINFVAFCMILVIIPSAFANQSDLCVSAVVVVGLWVVVVYQQEAGKWQGNLGKGL